MKYYKLLTWSLAGGELLCAEWDVIYGVDVKIRLLSIIFASFLYFRLQFDGCGRADISAQDSWSA